MLQHEFMCKNLLSPTPKVRSHYKLRVHTNNMNPYAKLDNFLQVHDLTYIIGQIFAVFSNKNA